MNVRILTPAVEEITDSALWLDSQAVGLGRAFWELVDKTLVKIGNDPGRFAKSEFANAEIDLRYAYVGKFKHVIHFLVDADQVVIVAVHHAARRPGYWLRRVKSY